MAYCSGGPNGFQADAFDWDAFQAGIWESAFEAQAFQNDTFQICILEVNAILDATEASDIVSGNINVPLEVVGIIGVGGAPTIPTPRIGRRRILREEEEIMLIISQFLYLEAA